MQKKDNFICLFSLVFVFNALSCTKPISYSYDRDLTNNVNQTVQTQANRDVSKQKEKWTELRLDSDDLYSLTQNSSFVFVIGRGKLIKLNRKLEVVDMQIFTRPEEFFTKDGGSSLIREKALKTSNNNSAYCSSEHAQIVGDFVYSVGPCEHSQQLWKFRANSDKSNQSIIVNYVATTYPNSDASDAVCYPLTVRAAGDNPVFPINLKSGPALITMQPNSTEMQTLWKGEMSLGTIVGIDFLNNQGIMLMQNGAILKSKDNYRR